MPKYNTGLVDYALEQGVVDKILATHNGRSRFNKKAVFWSKEGKQISINKIYFGGFVIYISTHELKVLENMLDSLSV
jgi:hypothetical protein